jgi:hypothetical protein
MNCQYCGATIARDHHGEQRWRKRRFCSLQCTRSATAETQRERAHAQFALIEELLSAGHTPEQVLQQVGLTRKAALEKCHRYGRPDLNYRLRKGEPPVLRSARIIHGSDAGYQAHHQRDEQPCTQCTKAHATANAVREAIRAAKAGSGPRQITNPTDDDWAQAACKGDGDPDDWFPDQGEWQRAARAKITCYTQCPLRAACAAMALESDADWTKWGIWGGLSPHERARLKAAS